ncbi:SGNH/GDSL hydrolase family protein [Pontibacter vulgaris]|uniref:SGNH/GDSL hydrolase family protein n=1 Tax=Pontibacter vulgaris TaxID=2905679 RepID=UPI001FA6FFFC|nr:SGNH/GDSL hydrolase family protein [Pontibacter vulgaris]
MKNFIYKSGMLALFAATVLTSCDPEIDGASPSKGEADFTKYVAVGNSLTAGYSDGGLYREGQLNSYPSILAEQFKLAGGGEFTQPLFTEAQKNGSGYLSLTGFDASGLPILKPVTTELAVRGMGADNKTLLYTEYLEPVNNLGVPGIKMIDVSTAGYGYNNPIAFNPYYERLLPNDVTPSGALRPYVATAAATQPTFFTMWLGNNDVLSYATSGGIAAISDLDKFKTNLDAMVNALVGANNAKGAIINIPDVTGVPFFTTKATATLIQMAAAANTKLYIVGSDNVTRVATTADYVLLTSTVGTPEQTPVGTIPHGFSPYNPLRNNEVLDNTEVATAQAATANFNNALAAAAQAKGLALVNMNTFFNSVKMKDNKPQLTINNIAYSPAFISGNLFSLDGVHLTPRGNAIVANEIIRNINATYKANIPTVDETKYRAVLFP